MLSLPREVLVNIAEQLTIPDSWLGTTNTLPDFLSLSSTCWTLYNLLDGDQTIWSKHDYTFVDPAAMRSFIESLPSKQFMALRSIRLQNITCWTNFDAANFEVLVPNHRITLTIDVTEDLKENLSAWSSPSRGLERSIARLYEARMPLRRLTCVRIGRYSEPKFQPAIQPDQKKLKEELRGSRSLLQIVLDKSCGVIVYRGSDGELWTNYATLREKRYEEDRHQQNLKDNMTPR